MIEWMAAMSVVLGALVVLRALILRLSGRTIGGSAGSRIQLVESRALGIKQHVHLVEIDGHEILVGSSEAGLQKLMRLPARKAPVKLVSETSDRPGIDLGHRARRRLLTIVSGGLGVLPHVWVLGVGIAAIVLGLLVPETAFAQAVGESVSSPTLSVSVDGATAPDEISDTMQIVLILTAISVAPSILLMATCFTRILIVLALLRQAIGTATLPPTQVLVGLALMTTIYVMTPVGETIYAESMKPYIDEEIGGEEALDRGIAPVREYLLSHTREDDLLLFLDMKGQSIPEEESEVSLPVLMPAFMISEIRTAFEIGFMIYLPFLIVDLVIASMLISLGMIMLPPVMIALPFKLMLFVLVDGWNLTLSALVAGLQ